MTVRDRIKGFERVKASDLLANPKNWREHPKAQADALSAILEDVGIAGALIARETPEGLELIDGHLRADSSPEVEWPVLVLDVDQAEADLLLASYDPLSAMATTDADALADLLQGVKGTESGLKELLTDMGGLKDLLKANAEPNAKLSDRFGVPPFSVLDTRQGYWQDRKRQWLAMGIKSELGREHLKQTMASKTSEYMRGRGPDTGGSVFDPVLCELMYSWFSDAGNHVLDPFAGGSVRGVVAGLMGRSYTGIELRLEQVEANRQQWKHIKAKSNKPKPAENLIHDPTALTPIEKHGDKWLKRDDLLSVAGVRGGKVRTCWALAQGAPGLVTASSKSSPQANIVAHIAKELRIPSQIHTPSGKAESEVIDAQACGAERVEHKPGYNSVIIKRARDVAKQKGWAEIPFGMECEEAVSQTRRQVPAKFPKGVKRLVMPVGSGMSLAGVLWGLKDQGHKLPVVGVVVGADPEKRLEKYAPDGWRTMVDLTPAGVDYQTHIEANVGGVQLDPVYEAKCVKVLTAGDLLWVVGVRATALPAETIAAGDVKWIQGDSTHVKRLAKGGEYDLLFSCPPYGDLEVYSDDPADISNMPEAEFDAAYGEIINESCKLLKDDTFAVFVVGEYRNKKGLYANFVAKTIQAFLDAGLAYYNEGILVNAIGSLPVRVNIPFTSARKLGKTHQNILVFVKGDAKKATSKLGDVVLVDITAKEDANA